MVWGQPRAFHLSWAIQIGRRVGRVDLLPVKKSAERIVRCSAVFQLSHRHPAEVDAPRSYFLSFGIAL
jgi:hypothetical protein